MLRTINKTKITNEKIKLENGIVLTKRPRSSYWQYYFTLDKKSFRKSTGTGDLNIAKTIAQQDYYEFLTLFKNGQPVKGLSFKELCKQYHKSLEGQNKLKFHKETLQRHFAPYFDKFTDINKIRKSDLHDYVLWRKEKYRENNGHEPLPQTLNKEVAPFNQMMRLAFKNEWLAKELYLDRESEKDTHNRRPHFKDDEYSQLIRESKRHLDEMKNTIIAKGKDPIANNHYCNAALLRDIILILAHTGMRVGELKTVRWCDIDMKNGIIKLNKAGKVKSSRDVIARPQAIASFKKIKQRRLDYVQKHGGQFSEKEPIQCLPNGTLIHSFKKGFSALLDKCGFKYEEEETRHTFTSLRHTYATYRLKTKTKDNTYVPMDKLAIQMGTSSKMIRRHYGHDNVHDYKEMFR